MKTALYKQKRYQVLASQPSIINGSTDVLIRGHGKVFVVSAGSLSNWKLCNEDQSY